jgi:ApaG protein
MPTPLESNTVSNNIGVRVTPEFLPSESDPNSNRFVFGYHIVITNWGERTVQLLERHWVILDADGERRDVRGAGVIGKQPILGPGESFDYRSGCPLNTAWGTMEGTYKFRYANEAELEIADGLPDLFEGLQETIGPAEPVGDREFFVTVGRFYLVASGEGSPR